MDKLLLIRLDSLASLVTDSRRLAQRAQDLFAGAQLQEAKESCYTAHPLIGRPPGTLVWVRDRNSGSWVLQELSRLVVTPHGIRIEAFTDSSRTETCLNWIEGKEWQLGMQP